MKKVLFYLIILFAAEATYSQKIILHRNTGNNQTYYLSSIDSITFLPFACSDQIRYEGKTYNTIQIGSQCWLKENLDIGTMTTGGSGQTNNGTIEKYCYNNDTANCTTYGGLYQWNEAMQYVTTEGAKGICPNGWHIPTLAELQTLKAIVNNDGNSLKAIGQGTGGGAGTNTSGFSALLAGYIHSIFEGLGGATWYWSSTGGVTAAYYVYLLDTNNTIGFYYQLNWYGVSIRCLKD